MEKSLRKSVPDLGESWIGHNHASASTNLRRAAMGLHNSCFLRSSGQNKILDIYGKDNKISCSKVNGLNPGVSVNVCEG